MRAIWHSIGIVAVCLWATCIYAADGIDAVTKPSKDVTLSFTRPGQIAKVLVKEGQDVKQGEALVQQDDAAERIEADRLKAQAEDTIKIRAADADLAQKTADLKKTEENAKKGAASIQEVEHARLDAIVSELSRDLAKFEHTQDARKYEQTKVLVERMRLDSPIQGNVLKLNFKEGESAEALKDVVRVVNVEMLWIEVPVPTKQAIVLKTGEEGQVTFPTPLAGSAAMIPVAGKIIYIPAVADAASETIMIRLEVPNPTKRPAGEHVKVRFPQVEARSALPQAIAPAAVAASKDNPQK